MFKKTTAKKKVAPDSSSDAPVKKKLPNWLHTGQRANETFKRERERSELRRKASVQGIRFWLKPGERAHITFLDGRLDEDGMLAIPFFYEHRAKLAGRWQNFVCPKTQKEKADCPLCAAGNHSRYVGVCTVIDHRKIPSKRNPGKFYRNQPKLYVITPFTMPALQSLAQKRGGLAGWKVEVMRTGDQKAQIGDMWDFEEKFTRKALRRMFGVAEEEGGIKKIPVANYGEALQMLDGDELRQLGLGRQSSGSEPTDEDLDEDME
jgi:hypothetical protein